jgi:hypothetical protein
MVGGMLLIVSDFLELLVVGFDKVETYYHGNLCRRVVSRGDRFD